MDWKKESELFNQVACYYDKYRPSYPTEIIDTLICETGIMHGSRLLEIGAGSGKATELFINKGYDILCIEPGKDLAEIGEKHFIGNSVRFMVSRFEDCALPASHYDVIYSAQAFHWVPQPAGYIKCAYALKDNGYLALFWNMYVTYDNDTDKELLCLAAKHGRFADFLSEDECENRINTIASGIEGSRLFIKPKVFRRLWKQRYTADEYFGFTLTGNIFIQKSEEEKRDAYKDFISHANKHNGFIERTYLCALYIAEKQK